MFTIRCKYLSAYEKGGLIDLVEQKTISMSCDFYEVINYQETFKIVAKKHGSEESYTIHPQYAGFQKSLDAITSGVIKDPIDCCDIFIENANGKTIDAFKGSSEFHRASKAAVRVAQKLESFK